MPALLIDSDAWHCLRHLSWIDRLTHLADMPILLGERAARVELNDLSRELEPLETEGRIQIIQVLRGSPAQDLYKRWTREGVDRGEAEAIAWEASRPAATRRAEPVIFISNDSRARKKAAAEDLENFDVFTLLVWGAMRGLWPAEDAKRAIQPWEDEPKAGFCRPKDFTTVEASWAAAVGRLSSS